MDSIVIKGARQHNLKNLSLTIPKNKLVVFTGVSGSGKSSLAFDTIYAEGQRRYVESLSSYARQFLGIMDKPDLDMIEGLSPSISIDQKSTTKNPRSTVGTVTEIYDYLRLLYARVGRPHCSECGREVSRQNPAQIVNKMISDATLDLQKNQDKYLKIMILSPIVRDRKGEFSGLFDNIRSKGYRQIRIDGYFYGLNDDILLIKTNKHNIDVVMDRFTMDLKTAGFLLGSTSLDKDASALKSRITEAIEQAINLSDGLITVSYVKDQGFDFPDKPKKFQDFTYSIRFACPVCNISIPEIEPRTFSFNSPHGACEVCSGIGTILNVDPDLIIAPAISIAEGAIIPFAQMFYHDTWYSRTISEVCKIHNIDMKIPFKNLDTQKQNILLYGTGDQSYQVYGKNRIGEDTFINETFKGVISELKRRHSETQSDFVRLEIEKYMRQEKCTSCQGLRLKKSSLTVTIGNKNITEITYLSVSDLLPFMDNLSKLSEFTNTDEKIAQPIVKEIRARLKFLADVGLEYLTLGRAASTLSGGESQRIRLASQIGSGLSGVLYVLDEPSIGLHQRDNRRLIETLKKLRDLDNTVIVVEHDREMMEESDWLVDFGPGAGKSGGYVVSQGDFTHIVTDKNSLTGKYLSGQKNIIRSDKNLKSDKRCLSLIKASQNNLKNIDVSFPLGKLICVTGVSGSGKSTLIVETLYHGLMQHFNPFHKDKAGKFEKIEGLELIDKVVLIDQDPIGRTPRSNPCTYTGIFTYIRELFSQLPAAKIRGFTPGRFSFNVRGGRCEACEGDGQKRIEMQFLSDVYITCEVCKGTRYNSETLEILYANKNIAEILDMTIDESLTFFTNHPGIFQKLNTLKDVGLGYMHLGQPATTLSGGEAQRVKLATELMKRATGKTLYILDEPTTGLHFSDLEKLLNILHRLTVSGNTVIVIEHNLDIIKNSDWIIDMGPEGGDRGGQIIASGLVEDIKKNKTSYTGTYL